MAPPNQLSPIARIALALLCVAAGLIPVLAAFDIGPLDSSAINGPPWLGAVAGGMFILAGLAIATSVAQQSGPLSSCLFAILLAGFASIANWIAFGAAPRQCSIAVAGLLFGADSRGNEIACRAGFGIGAGLIDAVMIWMTAAALRDLFGPGALPRFIEKCGTALFLIALAPILLPVFVWLIGRSALEAYASYRKTGHWPRNESFIARMKKLRPGRS
jgi:hypothetical protein